MQPYTGWKALAVQLTCGEPRCTISRRVFNICPHMTWLVTAFPSKRGAAIPPTYGNSIIPVQLPVLVIDAGPSSLANSACRLQCPTAGSLARDYGTPRRPNHPHTTVLAAAAASAPTNHTKLPNTGKLQQPRVRWCERQAATLLAPMCGCGHPITPLI